MLYKFQNHFDQIISIKKFLKEIYISNKRFRHIDKYGAIFDENGKNIDLEDNLMPFEKFTIELPDEKSDDSVNTSYEILKIIFENEHFLVVDKPIGIATVPGPNDRKDTLTNRIKGYMQDTGSLNMIPHIINRLDYDTSGLVLVAKNSLSASMINLQLESHKVKKEYIALLQGKFTSNKNVIDLPIQLSDDGIHREVSQNGEKSVTKYKILKHYPEMTLVSVRLLTGKTHQIRVHFKYLGHPLVGDRLYGIKRDDITRQALHANYLEFYDAFSNITRKFKIPLPEDINNLL